MLTLLLVATGGAIGSVARHLVSRWVQQKSHSGFPWGTYAVNATGTFLIGIVFGMFDSNGFGGDGLAFLVSGLLGGYTTFSTFSTENMTLLQYQRYAWLLQNTIGQIAIGLLLAAIGYWLGTAVIG